MSPKKAPIKDEGKYNFDIDFIVMHSKYFVVRQGKDIYFLDLSDDANEFTRIALNLREGIVN